MHSQPRTLFGKGSILGLLRMDDGLGVFLLAPEVL